MANQNLSVSQEFAAGLLAGLSKIYTGQPFDIVKVRLQSFQGANKPSPWTVVKNLIKYEGGPTALWKGSLPPLLGIGATVSLQFGVNANVKKALLESNNGAPLSFKQMLLAGGLGGFANCIVSIPAEHFRIRMQTQSKDNPLYKGSIDCMKKIFQTYGMKGVVRGAVPTIFRDSIGYGLYFAVYGATMNYLAPGLTPREQNLAHIGLAGVLGGLVFWQTVLPIDVVKTRLQTDNLANPQYKGSLDAARKVYQAKGLAGFYQGYVPCMLRAIPVNGVVFMLNEVVARTMLRSKQPKLIL